MTLEECEKRLKEIEKTIEQHIANYNVLMGGKQECLYWINKLKDVNVSDITNHEEIA